MIVLRCLATGLLLAGLASGVKVKPVFGLGGLGGGLLGGVPAAQALVKAYPVELNTDVDGVLPSGKEAARVAVLARNKAAESGPQRIYGETERLIVARETAHPSPLGPHLDVLGMVLGPADAAGTVLWALAIFLGLPSPLLFLGVTEGSDVRFADRVESVLGRALGQGDAEWLQDRDDGFKASAPLPLTAAVAVLSLPAGFLLGQGIAAAVGADHGWAASLGGCAAIAAGALEVGRPRRLTREEKTARDVLWGDFDDFATLRMLRKSGGVHVSDVVRNFRSSNIRYMGANRATDSDIEVAVRAWYGSALTSAGFLRDVVLLSESDAMEQATAKIQAFEANTKRQAA